MTGVILKDIRKSYGQVKVLHGIDLDIKQGEFIVFVGPSGCGKSTLLRMIAGLEEITGGEMYIDGQLVNEIPPSRRGIAMVFQSYALYPHMTVRDNMAFGLKNIAVERSVIDARIAEAARMLEIGHLLERKPGQLSGGQRQRVAIGRAVVKEPKAFLFDEPLSNLDAALRTRTRIELAQLHQRLKSTMIFVTHDQIEAMTLADRIVVMNNRQIEQIGTPMEIYNRPASRFVAGFVGAPAMNFLPVTIGTDAGLLTVETASGIRMATAIPAAGIAPGAFELGLRSEDVRITSQGGGNAEGVVDVVERLGERTLIYTRLADGQQLVGSDSGDSRVSVGDRVALSFDSTKAHLFDASGRAWHAREVGHG